ncbi:hypothetical protein J7T55_010710 [Diaporthe amygdali]|uniref:uncharacterized protein n=1 Tax=Phomopsis amygdali TaxID=1214568 RepID=UPI0022FDB4C2|nr:uncharacterized protein J7T55_010710 [Diaporthe amygdali]KAJ0114321.1 hypothetical protein J7T55_010710 [Diaporthe amygdali]
MNLTIITNNADILNRQEMRGGTNELAKALDRVAAREAAQGVDKAHMLLMTKEEAAKLSTRSTASATSTSLLQLESLNTEKAVPAYRSDRTDYVYGSLAQGSLMRNPSSKASQLQ